MFSSRKSNDLDSTDKTHANNMHFTSSFQPFIRQITQPTQLFYWNPNFDANDTQSYYNNNMPPSFVSTVPHVAPIAPLPLYHYTPHHASHQPLFQPLPSQLPVPSLPYTHPALLLTNSQSLIGNQICTASASNWETQSSGHESVSASLSNGSLDRSSWTTKLSHCVFHRPWEGSVPEVTVSTVEGAICTSVSTSFPPLKANVNLDSSKNLVSEDSLSMNTSSGAIAKAAYDDLTSPPPKTEVHSSSYDKQVPLTTKASPEVNTEDTADDVTRASTSTSSSSPKTNVHLSCCDDLVSKCSQMTEVTVKNSIDRPTGIESDSQSPPNANMSSSNCDNSTSNPSAARATRSSVQAAFPAPSATSSQSIPAVKTQKSQRYTSCLCRYCRVDDIDRPRFPDGRIKHICHFRDCGRAFSRPGQLKRHLKWHSGKNYPCGFCEEGFARKDDFLRHTKLHEVSKIGGVRSSKQHICQICKKVFLHGWSLRRHLCSHSIKKKFVCRFCDKGFSCNDALKAHSKKVHKIVEPVQALASPASATPRKSKPAVGTKKSPKLKYIKCECPYCRVNGVHRPRYKDGSRIHLCAECGQKFNRPSLLEKHEKLHEGKKLPRCSATPKRITPAVRKKNQPKLKNIDCDCPNCIAGGVKRSRFPNGSPKHLRAEYGRKFPCYLKEHLKLHEGKKFSFFCDHCERGFFQKKALGLHLKSHENTQSNGCKSPNCSSESGHRTVGHKRKPQHVGPECKKVFGYGENLKRYIALHNGEKEFVCAHCGKKFARQSALKYHAKKIHKEVQQYEYKDEQFLQSNSAKTTLMPEIKNEDDAQSIKPQPGCQVM